MSKSSSSSSGDSTSNTEYWLLKVPIDVLHAWKDSKPSAQQFMGTIQVTKNNTPGTQPKVKLLLPGQRKATNVNAIPLQHTNNHNQANNTNTAAATTATAGTTPAAAAAAAATATATVTPPTAAAAAGGGVAAPTTSTAPSASTSAVSLPSELEGFQRNNGVMLVFSEPLPTTSSSFLAAPKAERIRVEGAVSSHLDARFKMDQHYTAWLAARMKANLRPTLRAEGPPATISNVTSTINAKKRPLPTYVAPKPMGQRSERRERVETSELENRIISLFETNQSLLNIADILKQTNQARASVMPVLSRICERFDGTGNTAWWKLRPDYYITGEGNAPAPATNSSSSSNSSSSNSGNVAAPSANVKPEPKI